jgi:phage/plasmid primase-like uncharacterized protein
LTMATSNTTNAADAAKALTAAKAEFAVAIKRAGLVLDGDPIMDGTFHRLPVSDGKGTRKDGAYIGFADGRPSGHIENFKSGRKETWSAEGVTLTVAEREEFAEQMRQAKAQRSDRLATQHKSAAQRVAVCWAGLSEAPRSASDNAYLSRKGVTAHGVRFDGDVLVVPARDIDGKLWSLQRIAPGEGGAKLFEKGARKAGNMHVIGQPQQGAPILIAEGYATAASLHQATGRPVVVAFDAGNLDAVAGAIKKRFPDAPITIMGDDDRHRSPNVGRVKATAAATKHGLAVAFPKFAADGKGTDFNDLHAAEGVSAVKAQVENALNQPLARNVEQNAAVAALSATNTPAEPSASRAAPGAAAAAPENTTASVEGDKSPVSAKAHAASVVTPEVVALDAIKRRSADVASMPRDAIDANEANAWVKADLASLKAISEPVRWRQAALTLGHNAQEQISYKVQLTVQDPESTKAVAAVWKEVQGVGIEAERKQIPPQNPAAMQKQNTIEYVEGREPDGADSTGLRKSLQSDRAPPATSPEPLQPRQPRQSPDASTAQQPLLEAKQQLDSNGSGAGPRPTFPPLEDRFNVVSRFLRTEYHFRDQGGQVAFTEHWRSIKSSFDAPGVVKGMLDRAQERGWTTVRVGGAPEFQRQAWIAATARGIKAVGYVPTDMDKVAASEDGERLSRERGAAPTVPGGTVTRESDRASSRPDDRTQGNSLLGRVVDSANFATPVASSPAASARPTAAPTTEAVPDAMAGPLLPTSRPSIPANESPAGARHYVGHLLEHGDANYKFDPKKEASYYVKIASANGERIVWGIDLKRAVLEAGVAVGHRLTLEHQGVKPVAVEVKDYDAAGRLVGVREIAAMRNTWHASNPDQQPDPTLRAQAKLVAQDTQTKSRTATVRDEVSRLTRYLSAAPASAPVAPSAPAPDAAARSMPATPSKAREANVYAALEAAFVAKGVPQALRDELRQAVAKGLTARKARGKPPSIKVYDPNAPRQSVRPVTPPQRDRDRQTLSQAR